MCSLMDYMAAATLVDMAVILLAAVVLVSVALCIGLTGFFALTSAICSWRGRPERRRPARWWPGKGRW